MDTKVKYTVYNDDPDGVKNNFVVRNRTLVHQEFRNLEGIIQVIELDNINKLLSDINARQDPIDVPLKPKDVYVYFEKGEMKARYKSHQNIKFLTSGASHFAQIVLPPYFWRGLKQLTTLPPTGEKIATETWNHFATNIASSKDYLVRFIRIQNPDKTISLAIRAVLSTSYGIYSNREFIQDMRYFMQDFGSIPVQSFTLTDQAMRINFIAIEETLSFLALLSPGVLEAEPLPIISAWNSEVGRGKVGLRAGLYNANVNGVMGHWDDSTEFTWIHRGGQQGLNLKTNIAKAYEKIIKHSKDILTLYRESKNIDIPDMEKWIKDKMAEFDTLPESLTQMVVDFTKDPKVTPGNKLATVLDAMMLASSKEEDIFRRADIEAATSRIMRRYFDKRP